MLDKINGISDINVSTPLHFDSYNNTHSPGLNVDVSGKGGGDSSPGGKFEEIMPILVKLTEQLMEMLQSDASAEDSMSGEGKGGDGVVPTAEESGSAGHSSSGEEESNNGAGMPMEGSAGSEKSMAGSGEMSAADEGGSSMSGELGEIMPMLVKLIEMLIKMMEGESGESSASGEGKGMDGTSVPAEGGMGSGDSMSAGSTDGSEAGGGSESSMSGESGEIMSLLAQLVEQLMAMLQGDSDKASAPEGAESGSAAPSSESESSPYSAENTDAAAAPMDGGMASEAPGAENGEASSDMSGELGEIMPMLVKLIEMLMKMMDGASTEGSASAEGKGADSASAPTEGGMGSGESMGAGSADGSEAAGGGESPMSGESGEMMPSLAQLVEQLMAMLQGGSDKASASEGAESGSAAPSAESDSSAYSPAESGENTDATAAPMESGMASEASSAENGEAPSGMKGELGEILQLLAQLIEQLMAMMEGDSGEGSASGEGAGSGGASAGDSSSSGHPSASGGENNSGAVTSTEGGIKPEASSGGSSRIPAPSEHMQSIDLGGKSVTIGGDGTASAAEVQSTTESIQGLYQNSDTFRSMIDSSSDEAFEVSVGKRDDNTSWGNSEGRVFMNINNVEPGNSDTFQSLLGHEFAHASIDIGHGGQMEQLESRIAAEA